jgi:hypothetical protein
MFYSVYSVAGIVTIKFAPSLISFHTEVASTEVVIKYELSALNATLLTSLVC